MNAVTRKRRPKRAGAKGKASVPTSAVTVTSWDQGATGRANRHNLVQEAAADADPVTGKISNPNGIKRMRRVDMLEVWHRKGEITTAGFNAAEKLRNAFEATQRAPGWPDNDRVQSSPKPDHAVTIQIDRISKYHAIAKHIPAEDQPIISHCVLLGGLPSSLRLDGKRPYHGAGWANGLAALDAALNRLANATS